MQNFTLGKRGIPMLLFALILLTSSFTSFAQNCPTVADTTQDFCYLATVSDLEATANGDTVRWYRTATSPNPIPENELLQTQNYYAGNTSGTCTIRVLVSVTIDDAGAPEPQFGNIFAPCVYGTSTTDVKTVQDLINNIDGYLVEIYGEEFSGSPLDPSTELIIGESYYAGQRNADNTCPTSRVAVRYDPIFAPAPTADPVQTFCDNATVADLVAQATSDYSQGFRWYSTATSQPALASTTQLIHNETYYVSQIVNREGRNEPPCESRDRFEVTVEILSDSAGEDNTDNEFCRNELSETVTETQVRNYFLSLLSAGASMEGTFSNQSIADITADFNNRTTYPVTYSTTYTVEEGTICEDSAILSVTVLEAPNAGADNSETYCDAEIAGLSETEFEDLFRALLEDGISGGDFGSFPSYTGPGTYTATYTIDSNINNCSDSAVMTIIVTENPNAGDDNTDNQFCRNELAGTLTEAQVRNYFLSLLSPGATQGGTFSSQSIEEITADFNSRTNFPVTYSTTYTVGEGNCTDTALLSVTVNPSPDAPEAVAEQFFCPGNNATVADLQAIGQNLIWYEDPNLTTVADQNDPLIDRENYFVTQTNDSGCESAATQVTAISETDAPEAEAEQAFCQENNPTVADLEATGENLTWYEDAALTTVAAQNDALIDGEDYFVTQTIAGCESEATLVNVAFEDAPNAGQDTDLVFCQNEFAALLANIDLLRAEMIELIGDDVDTNGVFTNDDLQTIASQYLIAVNTNNFPFEAETTYTVTNDAGCTSSSNLTLTVNPSPNAGENGSVTVSRDDDQFNLFTELEGNPDPDGTWSPGNANGSFDPATGESGVYTYTVTNEFECTDSATVTVTVLEECPVVENTTQEFCQMITDEESDELRSPTVADLMPADATWYATADTETPLANSTVLVDGEIYYAGNEDATCPDRTPVTVNILDSPNAGTDSSSIVCNPDVQGLTQSEVRTLYLNLLDEGVSRTGTFEPTIQQLIDQYNNVSNFGDFTTTYTLTNEAGCIDTVQLTITVLEVTEAEAGTIDNIVLDCGDDDIVILDDSLLSEGATMGGTFTGEGVNEDGNFDPTIGPGTYEITYTVSEEQACVTPGTTDFTTFTITVQGNSTIGGPIDLEMCITEAISMLDDPSEAIAMYYAELEERDIALDGTFSPMLEVVGVQIITYINNPTTDSQLFQTTYTVTTDCGEESVLISLTINNITEASTGEIGNVEVCSSENTFDLNSLLVEGENTFGGTFSYNSSEIEGGLFDISEVDSYEITYTVSGDEDDCTTDGSTTFTLTVTEIIDAEAGTIDNIVLDCGDDDIVILDDSLLSEGATMGGTFTGEGVNEDGNFDPIIGPGTYEITYTVSEEQSCVTPGTTDFTTFTITVQGNSTIGGPIDLEMCITEAIAMLDDSSEAIAMYYAELEERDIALDGTFSPMLEVVGVQIITYINNPTTDSKLFQTTYTVTTDCGEESVLISLTINNITEASTGEIGNVEVCSSENTFDLNSLLVEGENTFGGTFSYNSSEIEGGLFDISAVDSYEITYTVSGDEGECTTDGSTTFTLTVTENDIFVGEDNDREVCNSEVRNLSTTAVRNLYLGLLTQGVSQNGTFNPTITELINQYNLQSNYGDFTTMYTITEGDCEASVELTITVLENPAAPVAESEQFFCSDTDPTVADLEVTGANLMWYTNASLTIPANATDALVDGQNYYAVAGGDVNSCLSAATIVTVTIGEAGDFTVADTEPEFCTEENPTVADLEIEGENYRIYTDAELTTEASLTDALTDGSVYYVSAVCGSDTVTITVTVRDTPPAPVADEEQFFCLIEEATVARLVATGDGDLTWYTDEALTTPAASTDALEDGDVYYVVSSTGDSACETSEAAMVTVVINDSESPTISTDGNEFCRQDNPTVQELINNLSGTGIKIYNSATGGTALSATTLLQNDVTYYATATDPEFNCESSERRAIIVEVQFCGIPEGFSPNGDDINDRFVIEDIAEDYPNYTIEIFNRWGNVVFKGNASTPDWDGVSNQSSTLGDKVLPAGVYFYIVNYNDGSTPPAQGKLYLSR